MPSFTDLGVRSDIVTRLTARGVVEPFPIQAATISDALAGRDVCGRAPTGSGKTIAFGIPMVTRVGKAAPRAPRGLVLVPTRELATQVANELIGVAGPKVRIETVFGGVAYGNQLRALRRGVDILVACPGRLKDLVDRNELRLDAIEFVVLDEADRMADMGFLPEVRRILDQVRSDRQTLLFSATLDGDINTLIERYQHNPAKHEVEGADDAPVNEHHFWKTDRAGRVKLAATIASKEYSSIVFCRTKHGADRLATQLEGFGVTAAAIHGDRTQKQRERALDAFTRGKVQCLVATDIAARGIHVDNVGCVIHFDPAGDDKDYIHRSGRTGRAGAAGTVISLVMPDQVKLSLARQRRLGYDAVVAQPSFEPGSGFVAERSAPQPVAEAPVADKPFARRDDTPRRDAQPRREHKPERRSSAAKFERRNDWQPKAKAEWKPKAEYDAERAAAAADKPGKPKRLRKPATTSATRAYTGTARPPRGAKVGEPSRGRKQPAGKRRSR